MIKRLALILWLIPLALTAQVSPVEKAAAIARGVMGSNGRSLKTGFVQDSVIPVGNSTQPDLFVVTFNPTGFVLVSNQPSRPPVLGYSLDSDFPDNPAHPLRSWLLAVYENSARHRSTLKYTEGARYSTDHIVKPLVTAKWGQGDPWNRYCPVDDSGRRALVGCVAVAMSQIMEKWHWPEKGAGKVSYTPLLHPGYGPLTVNFDSTQYLWDQTHDLYSTDVSALILYHAGVSTYMNYDPWISNTSVDRFALPALIHNFTYHPSMVFRDMEVFPESEWIRLLHQELDNNRPVLYAGTSPDGKSSHAFNIDGYRNDNYFHFNWGWNGAGDGWYTLSGMAGGGADFSTQQGAIFGIQPSNLPMHDRPSALEALPGDGFVQLFCDQPVITDFSHFNVYRNGIKIGQTGSISFRDDEVINGQTYTYALTAMYQGEIPGESLPTPEVKATPWEAMQPVFRQFFESGPAGWQFQDSVSGFRIGHSSTFGLGGNNGYVAAIISEGHPAGEAVADYLTSPVIYTDRFSHPAISFDYLFRQNPGIDTLMLMWRDFTTGKWERIASLDSTGGYSDWRNVHFYLPQPPDNHPIQIAFYYNDAFGQGFGAAIDNITIYEVAEPAEPEFSTDQKDLCREQAVVFTDLSEGSVQTWEWDFGAGAEPRVATTKGPHQVVYHISGEKTVKLSLNHLDHLQVPKAISIRDKPVAGFDYQRKSQVITFTGKPQHTDHLLWLFGDGTSSTEANPAHTYYTKSLFEVSQIAYNGTCQPDTLTVNIDMRPGTGIDEQEELNRLTIFPNPARDKVTLLWNTPSYYPLKIRIISASGQVFLLREYPPQQELTLDLSNFPAGIYILQIASGKWIRNEQIFKINN